MILMRSTSHLKSSYALQKYNICLSCKLKLIENMPLPYYNFLEERDKLNLGGEIQEITRK
jgi:hypothetical protein